MKTNTPSAAPVPTSTSPVLTSGFNPASISVIAVLREHEGQGIGKRLLTLLEQWLSAEGWRESWLATGPDERCRAAGCCRRQGWEDWKLEGGSRFMRKRLGRT